MHASERGIGTKRRTGAVRGCRCRAMLPARLSANVDRSRGIGVRYGVGGATHRGGPETSRVITVTRMRLAVFAIAAGIAWVPVTAVAGVAGTVDSLAGSVSVIRSDAP